MNEKTAHLKWYAAMGIEEIAGDEPQNRRLSQRAAHSSGEPTMKTAAAPLKPLSSGALMPPKEAIQLARAQAAAANTLAELKEKVLAFDAISLKRTATNTVFADGNPQAKIMLIGEAPGAEEDVQGIPFCGASGQLLDQMLSYIGLSRQKNFYISNTIFWRPPGNRRPTPEELAICTPFVEKHIALIEPKLIVLVGGTAVAALYDPAASISRVRGKFLEYKNDLLKEPIPMTAIFHPSYLLRSPGQKRVAWKDLLQLQMWLEEKGVEGI